MTDRTESPRRHQSGDSAYEQLKRSAALRGMTLLPAQWQGRKANYLFRCGAGHQFERSAAVMLRGTATCLQCQQDTIRERFDDMLRQRGYTNEEGTFLGLTTRHRLQCTNGHRWETEARKITEGHGCPRCTAESLSARYTLPDGLERLQQAAREHGGRCLADSYHGMRAGYEWECADGHRWHATGGKVVSGSWCRICLARRNGKAQRDPDGLARLKSTAASHGGVCLDDTYQGSNARYRFRCAQGHEWIAWGHLVLRGTWCGPCANRSKRLGIERMRAVARERGGRCLSDAYLNNRTKLVWECHLGHVWSATSGTIIHRGAWCPDCFRLRITKKPHLRRRYEATD